MAEYQYFHFNALTEQQVIDAFPDKPREFMHDAYIEWIESFCRRAQSFYRSQILRHHYARWMPFCAEQGIREDSSLSDYGERIAYAWEMYPGQLEYQMHEQQHEKAMSYLDMLERKYKRPKPLSDHAADIMQRFLDVFEAYREGRDHPELMTQSIDELWFNTVIDTPPEVSDKIRWIPYKQYLWTEHWRRVRAAALLIHNSRCQGDDCVGSESYWLDEDFVHVHHTSYDNRGHERYNDLRLLCKRCHQKLHDQGVESVLMYPEMPFLGD